MKHTFYLAYPKAEESPIMLAIRDKAKRVAISLSVIIRTEDWDKEEQRAAKSCKEFRLVNEKIAEAERAVKRALNYGKLDNLSIQEVANLYRKEMGLEVKETKVNNELFIPFYRMWAHTSFGKHTAYRYNKHRFRKFEEIFGKANPTFQEVDYNLYVKYLTELQKQNYKPNMQGSFIKDLKAAMNEAYKRGLHTNTAFKRFEKPSEQVTTVYLTVEELKRIRDVDLIGELDKVRDMFLLESYTGLRYTDCRRLTGEDADKEFITKVQQKTLNNVCIPIHPVVKKILKKHNGAPKISQQKTNLFIKTICAQVGINDDIEVIENGKIIIKKKWQMVSSHTGRRSAATNLLLNDASIHEISRFLGHSSVSQTQIYLRLTSEENAKILAKNKFFTEE